jgi:predicted Fe-Mo cluster-binding NifX family protein
MKLCFPVNQISDLESEVYGHFGSAPAFVIVDSDTKAARVVHNADRHHIHGRCNPLGALEGQEVDVVIVGGIGGGALMKLNTAGIDVYKAMAKTIRENIELFSSHGLPLFQPGHVCGGHSGACSH